MEEKLDKRIIELLKRRGIETEEQLAAFLEPDESLLHDPMLLRGMAEAKERIERAIKKKEKIVVYGDYDCDGISACAILYRYFRWRKTACDVYIPDRFDDGYGLSENMINEVLERSKPSLIITVDLGVTAIKEVEIIKKAGVDIIVTDHHEPSDTIPDCVVIDPKIEGQEYPYQGLCGAGVALKLVQALSGVECAKRYLDLCAIATIGDIVPLTDENRYIARRGIELINKGKCLKSYRFMLAQLGLRKLCGTDVTFKIVPRLNASGRMSKGKKVFDFLIAEDEQSLSELYADMARDNDERLRCISEGAKLLEDCAEKLDFKKENIILLSGEFHQGVLGILASRVCHDYNRPAIVFTKTDEGTLKGSGRSVGGVDIHEALESCKDLLIRFGGHKMAVGVELKEENFEAFKKAMHDKISSLAPISEYLTAEQFDIEITEEDICEEFICQLERLEPFGCKNERPVLMMQVDSLRVSQMKDPSFRHFKLVTKKGKSIVAFAADRHIDALKAPCKKDLIIELENNEYKGKIYPQAILKNVYIKDIALREDSEQEACVSLLNKFFSQSRGKTTLYSLSELEDMAKRMQGNGFGTLIVIDSAKNASRLGWLAKSGYTISHLPLKNRQNTILISPRGLLSIRDAKGYNNIIFTRQLFPHEKDCFAEAGKVWVPQASLKGLGLDKSREANVYAYNLIRKYAAMNANNIFEWLEKVKAAEGGISKTQLLFSLLVFVGLGFVNLTLDEFMLELVMNPPKRELSSSKFMEMVK